jgi:hypothetical protein
MVHRRPTVGTLLFPTQKKGRRPKAESRSKTLILLSPDQHTDYQLIDSGGFEKLEKFGPYILSRPEPQAIWDKSLSEPNGTSAVMLFSKRQKLAGERPMDHERRYARKMGFPVPHQGPAFAEQADIVVIQARRRVSRTGNQLGLYRPDFETNA